MLKNNDPFTNYSDQELEKILHTTLQNTFKLNTFRSGQKEVLMHILRMKRLLCIHPTGHGKSLLYQLPAVLLPGITLVFSPLLALMRDQIQQLNQRFAIPSASFNSDQSSHENQQIKKKLRDGITKILFVAPEKLANTHYFNFFLTLPINFIVIDEAHCISTWGHDFRPSYRRILNFVHLIDKKNPMLRVLATTATANKKTEGDIIQHLTVGKHTLIVQRQSLARPNLALDVIAVQSTAEKLLTIKQLLLQLSGHGLIYCATRENTSLVANFLQSQNYQAASYHAGLPAQEKQRLQREFIANKYQIIAATNALGMGIDKADLRYIIHFDMVGSITAYYQEVGRAGRDGLPAQGILLFDEKDKRIQQHLINSMQQQNIDVKLSAIDLAAFQHQAETRKQELQQILDYGTQQSQCLMVILRNALGDFSALPCRNCSCCTKSGLLLKIEPTAWIQVETWLSDYIIKINRQKQTETIKEVALFDATLRHPLFLEFMRNRHHKNAVMSPEWWQRIIAHFFILQRQMACVAIIVIPSTTWLLRESTARILAKELNLPLYLDTLTWYSTPQFRQGNCVDDQQRKENVSFKMRAQFAGNAPLGPVLLLDDYIGSGATLREAARALRTNTHNKYAIIPSAIAQVTWQLGEKGFV